MSLTSHLRSRLLLLTLGPVLLVTVVMAAWTGAARLFDARAAQQTLGETLVRQIAQYAEPSLRSGELEHLRRGILTLLAESPLAWVSVENAAGTVIIREPAAEADAAENTSRVFEANVHALETRDPDSNTSPATASAPLGRIRLALDGAALRDIQRELLITMLVLPVSAALIALISLRLGLTAIITPLLRLRHWLHRLRNGQFDVPVEPAQGRGVLGTMERDLVALAQTLREQRATLQLRDEQSMAELRETLEELEIKNAELDIARKRALQASRIKSEFLANMSHEIRTPMNGVMGFIELLGKTELSGVQINYLQTIRASAQHLMTILNDILDLSKIEAGKLRLAKRPFDLRAQLETAVGLFVPNAETKGLSLILDIDPELPQELIGDGPRIAQIVTNFVSNAIKFTERGDIEVTARVLAQNPATATISLTVRDTGIGISVNDQERLFRAFDQLDAPAAGKQPGTGLGLAICRHLVDMMDGQLRAESTPGAGSSFQVTLTLEQSNLPLTARPRPPLTHLRAISVTRDPVLARALGHLLALRGVHALSCNNTAELTSLLREHPAEQALLIGLDLRTFPSAWQVIDALLSQRDTHLRGGILLIGGEDAAAIPTLCPNLRTRCIPRPPMSADILTALDELFSAMPTLPEPLARHDWAASAPQTGDNAGAGGRMHGLCVLIADDNLINRQLARIFLTQLGATVDEARDGEQAVQAAVTQHYDLILLDLHMPGVDGYAAAQRIRGDGLNTGTPIITLSGDALPAGERPACIDDHLQKPITEEALIGTLLRWSNRRPVLGGS
ncbi:ATP-binding protein [Plasticicumulans acidivorans]|uniref:histidine kinase n=1 Tax=Plasticicumulans acidivorans TaxID=886464 RepID=A0A317N244_9GAMM|nr:ATP-binding protein [Plasticicumulans acidivorans]PWV63363.1 Hpt sensor hybrid histidine kinase [Plasticicumulans acidivorans]